MINWPITIVRNKYLVWYENLVAKARTRPLLEGYVERHHVVPVSLGGNNRLENIITLSAREHYIAHLLLWRMSMDKKSHNKMTMALHVMVNGSGHKKQDRSYLVPSRIYEANRKEYVQVITEIMSGPDNKWRGRKHSAESLEKMRAWQADPAVKEQQRKRILGEKNPFFGKNHSEEMRRKIAASVSASWSEEAKEAKSNWAKEKWQDPEYKKTMLDIRKTSEAWINRDWKTINKKAAETKMARGFKHSEESKKKLSETRRAKIAAGEIVPWNKGKNTPNYRSKESAKLGALKAAATRKANGTQVSMKGAANPFFGKKHSEETKAKIRATKLAKKLALSTKD